jgi:hypothetical protein
MEAPKSRFTWTLAETLFTSAFATDPDQAVGPLITKCLEAAIAFDGRIETLTKAGLTSVADVKPEVAGASSPKEKRAVKRK